MDNAYVHGLRQYDNRPRSPVIVPHNLSELRKKILFENTLLEERALHEFSAGKGDGAGVDTGSAPLKPLTSPTPSPTTTPTPTPTPAPAGIPVASTNQIIVTNAGPYDGTYIKRSSGAMLTATYGLLQGTGNSYSMTLGESAVVVLIGPQMTVGGFGAGSWIIDYGYDDEEYGGFVGGTSGSVTNASTNITTIPTSGWTHAQGGVYGNFTITAA